MLIFLLPKPPELIFIDLPTFGYFLLMKELTFLIEFYIGEVSLSLLPFGLKIKINIY